MTFNKFSDTIIERRERRGWTQRELAEKCGLHWTAISQIERGVREPLFSTLSKLAKGFGITLSQLMEEPK